MKQIFLNADESLTGQIDYMKKHIKMMEHLHDVLSSKGYLDREQCVEIAEGFMKSLVKNLEIFNLYRSKYESLLIEEIQELKEKFNLKGA